MIKKESPNLKKQSLAQLQELLDRQSNLIRNTKLLSTLKDKGEAIKRLHENIQKEIQQRKDLTNIETSLANLVLTSESSGSVVNEKHVEYVCSKENTLEDTRYKPYKTLVSKEPPKRPVRATDLNSALEPQLVNEPTKLIPLAESLVIQNEQFHKTLEEKAKKSLSYLLVASDDESSDEEGICLED